jgi:hypothetical protein
MDLQLMNDHTEIAPVSLLVHPAIAGVLLELPQTSGPLDSGDKEKILNALSAVLDLLYASVSQSNDEKNLEAFGVALTPRQGE